MDEKMLQMMSNNHLQNHKKFHLNLLIIKMILIYKDNKNKIMTLKNLVGMKIKKMKKKMNQKKRIQRL